MRNENRDLSLLRRVQRVVPSGRLWNPAADVYRSEEGWIVKIDLAGVCSDELEIEIRESMLRISGCRKDTVYREGFVYQQMEITYSRFEKTLRFPASIEGATVENNFENGLLLIRLHKEKK